MDSVIRPFGIVESSRVISPVNTMTTWKDRYNKSKLHCIGLDIKMRPFVIIGLNGTHNVKARE